MVMVCPLVEHSESIKKDIEDRRSLNVDERKTSCPTLPSEQLLHVAHSWPICLQQQQLDNGVAIENSQSRDEEDTRLQLEDQVKEAVVTRPIRSS